MNFDEMRDFMEAQLDPINDRLKKIEERLARLEELFVPKSGRGKTVSLKNSRPGRVICCSPVEALPPTTNCFGHVLSEEEDGTRIPFNCTCGGSMRLCQPCALAIVNAAKRDGTFVHLYDPDV